MRLIRAAVLVTAFGLLLGGCGGDTPAAPTPSPSDTPPPNPVSVVVTGEQVVRCVGELPGAARATAMGSEDLPSGAVAGVAVRIPRPDLPRGANRVDAVEFPDPGRAADFARGSGAFVGGTGGSAEVVGAWVVTSTFGGNQDVADTLRRCVTG